MFRAISLIIITNYFIITGKSGTLFIDDIGEGLDYERSIDLMRLITKKTKNSKLQVILTSNDRHLLNGIDVEHWNILERKGGEVRAYNYKNSKNAFDDFIAIGLNNFDLFSNEMYKTKE